MPQAKSEKELIKGLLKQDRLAQKTVYEHYSARMLGLCMRYIRDNFEAEEVMLGGFLKVFQKTDQFKSQGSFEGWIRRIMVNECLNALRKKKLMYVEVDIHNLGEDHHQAQYESDIDAEELMSYIEALPIGYRTVFNLYAIEGYSHKEIAEKLGVSESTSKSQLSRARNLLQKCIEESQSKVKKLNHG